MRRLIEEEIQMMNGFESQLYYYQNKELVQYNIQMAI